MKSEVFDRQGQGLAGTAQPIFGWDPYEVWRTRVKAAPEEAILLSSGSVVGDRLGEKHALLRPQTQFSGEVGPVTVMKPCRQPLGGGVQIHIACDEPYARPVGERSAALQQRDRATSGV